MVYRGSPTDPLTYLRLVSHVFGHADFSHFSGNFLYILMLGPGVEEKYGTKRLVGMMAVSYTHLCHLQCSRYKWSAAPHSAGC